MEPITIGISVSLDLMLVEQLGLHHLKPQFQLSIHLHKQWILTGIDPV